MKFAHIADLHLGKVLNGHSLLIDQQFILQQILQQIEIHKVECLLIAGDIYDRSVPSAEAVQLFDNFLEKLLVLKVITIIISGNHDGATRLSFGSFCFAKSNIFLITEYQKKAITLHDKYGDIDIYAIPYMNRYDIRQALNTEEIPTMKEGYHQLLDNLSYHSQNRAILIAHQFVKGTSIPSLESSEELLVGGLEEVASPLFEQFDYVALGHIHRPEVIINHTGRIRYSGSPLAYSKAEAGQIKALPIFEIKEKGSFDLITVALQPLHALKHIKALLGDILKGNIRAKQDDYIYFELMDEYFPYGSIPEIIQKYPNYMSILPLQYKVNKEQNIAVSHLKEVDPLMIIEQWYKLVSTRDLSDQQKDWIKKIWLKEDDE